MRFFFNMSLDGADAMKNIYNFYSENDDKKNYCNYFEYFRKISCYKPKNPVILVFDNELKTKGKPLYKFSHACNLKLLGFEKGGNKRIVDNGNLFLVTHQIIGDKKESEIEDLFDEKVLNHKINGKCFTRNSDFDTKKFYGKEHFSQYILSNYEKIDFSKFRPLLTYINEIVCAFEKSGDL